jgi:hypothetical protein
MLLLEVLLPTVFQRLLFVVTLLFGGCVRAPECRWWKLLLWQLVMMFEGFGSTLFMLLRGGLSLIIFDVFFY